MSIYPINYRGIINNSLLKCMCYDIFECKYIVVSADFIFNRFYEKCRNQQLKLYSFTPSINKFTQSTHSIPKQSRPIESTEQIVSSDICINHYTLFIDTVFRLIASFVHEYTYLSNKYHFQHFIIENDLSTNHLPIKMKVYNKLTKSYMHTSQIYRLIINKLRILSKLLDDDMLADYDILEQQLAKRYKQYNFSMHYPKYKLNKIFQYKDFGDVFLNLEHYNRMPTKKYSNYTKRQLRELWYLIYLTQEHLDSMEIYNAFEYALNVISKYKKVSVVNIKCDSNIEYYKKFSYKILDKIPKGERVLFINNAYSAKYNCFYYNFKKLYYPLYLTKKEYISDNDYEIVKFKYKNKSILDYFDSCNSYCMNRMLDCFDYMTMEVFKDMDKTYNKCSIDAVKPSYFDMDEYSWLVKELYEQMMPSVIERFNRLFEVKCK